MSVQIPEEAKNFKKLGHDPSAAWGGGSIVEEYFDVGQSRSVTWDRRPAGSQLLAALKDPGGAGTPWLSVKARVVGSAISSR